jgi:hypothetical protein
MRARASATSLQFSMKMTPRPSPRVNHRLNLAVETQGNGRTNFVGHDFHDLLESNPRFWREDGNMAVILGCGGVDWPNISIFIVQLL